MPTLNILDLIAGIVSFLLTVMVLSYLFLGDNPLFRIAVYLFVGVSAGYAVAVVWHAVLMPYLVGPILTGAWDERGLAALPLLFGLFLFAKLSPRTSRLGNWPVAVMVAVGTAVAVGGAVLGTIFPQVLAATGAFDLQELRTICGQEAGCLPWRVFEASLMLVGTISTLAYFHFGARPGTGGPQRGRLVRVLAWFGQVFIAITFGVLFAGVYAAALTALVERILSLGSIF